MGIYGYHNIHLFDVDGTLLVSHAPFMEPGENVLTGSFRGTEFSSVFERTRHLLQPVLSNYQLYPGRKEAAAFMAGPIVQDGLTIGYVIFEFGNDQIFRVFSDYGGLGATGETIVAMRNGDELTFVSPSRFDATTAFRKKVRLGEKSAAIPMQRLLTSGPTRGHRYDRRLTWA